jgi:hypothetical protein
LYPNPPPPWFLITTSTSTSHKQMQSLQARTAWGIQGGRTQPQAACLVARPQGVEGSGRACPGESLGSLWIPLPIRPWQSGFRNVTISCTTIHSFLHLHHLSTFSRSWSQEKSRLLPPPQSRLENIRSPGECHGQADHVHK